MNVTGWTWMLAACVLAAGTAGAQTADVPAFGYTAPLGDGSEALRKVELPHPVLMRIERGDRLDVAVLDAQNRLMPVRIFGVQPEARTSEAERELAFFAVRRSVEQDNVRYSVEWSGERDRTVINLSAPGGDDALLANDYIVHVDRERTESLGDLAALTLDWQKVGGNVVAPLLIEGSDDLEDWSLLDNNAVISDLRHDGVALKKNVVELGGVEYEYLRIAWPAAEAGLELSGVTGRFSESAPAATGWRSAVVDCVGGEGEGCVLEIGALPVETIELRSELPNYFVQAALYSRASADDDWRRRGGVQQYRLDFDDATASQTRSEFPGGRHRSWKLEFAPSTATPHPSRVELRWRALYLVFVAQGEAPYQLRFGATAAPATASDPAVSTILRRSDKTLADVETVTLGPHAELSVQIPYWTRERVEVYALWAVLVLGVGVMLWIALGVFRRMTAPGE